MKPSSPVLAAALDYLTRGWSVLALCPPDHARMTGHHEQTCKSPGKAPYKSWVEFQERLPSQLMMMNWWREVPTANVGVCLGPVSGLLGLDVDGDEGRALLDQLSGSDLPATLAFQTGKGFRLLYQWPTDLAVANHEYKYGAAGEVRILAKGRQTVMPPSVHPATGEPYAWWPSCGPGEVAPAPCPEWLRRLVDPVKCDPQPRPWRKDAPHEGQVQRRARAYLQEMGPCRPEKDHPQDASTHLLSAANALAVGFGLDDDAAVSLLQEYAGHLYPEKELRRKVAESRKTCRKPRGFLLQGRPTDAPPAGPRAAASPDGCDGFEPPAPSPEPKAPAEPRKPSPLRLVPPFAPFPLACLPVGVREYVQAAATAIGCDPALVSVPVLAVLAGCIGNSRALTLKGGWSEPPVIWALTIAESGGHKTPAYEAAVKPLQELQLDLLEEHRDRQAEHERALEEWEAADRGGRGEKPRPPAEPPSYLTGDATIEAMGELLGDNPHGVLLARDEMDGWFQSFTRYKKGGGGTDRPQWLEMHKAGTLLLHRLTRERKRLSVRRAAVSLTGTIQPLILRDTFDQQSVESGLLARLLLAMPPERMRVWTEAEVPPQLAERYRRLLLDLTGLPLADAAKRKPHYLGLSLRSKQHWIDFYNTWGKVQYASEGEQKSAFAKIEAYGARLALVHHVVSELETGGPREPFGEGGHLPAVAETSTLAGIELARWFAAEALRVYATLHEGQDAREKRKLVEWIQGHRCRVTPRELLTSNSRKWHSIEQVNVALNDLVRMGLGVWEETSQPRGGHATQTFVLHENTSSTSCTRFDILADHEEEGDGDGLSDADDSPPEPAEVDSSATPSNRVQEVLVAGQ